MEQFVNVELLYTYIYIVDIEGLVGFIFIRVQNKFRLGTKVYSWHSCQVPNESTGTNCAK